VETAFGGARFSVLVFSRHRGTQPRVTWPVVDPSNARSTVRMRVPFADTDMMGIVHHGNYARYFEVARVEWLRRRSLSYAEWAANGIHLPVVDLTLRYRAPARFDEELDVEATLVEIRAAAVRFEYRIVRVRDQTLCTEGSTRLARVDDSHTPRRLPEDLIAELLRPERPA
jgi:acyl-CoA thioester hydrolase